MSKGEMSMQLIVTAVIVLLIAAILIFLVGSRVGIFGDATGACLDRGGSCSSADRCGDGEQRYRLGDVECRDDGNDGSICCIDGDGLFGNN